MNIVRLMRARQELLICVAIGMLTATVIPAWCVSRELTRMIIGWNVGAGIYLVLAMKLMFWSTHDDMRQRARHHDEGRVLILVLVVMAAMATLGSIVAELAIAKQGDNGLRNLHIGLAVLTLLTSWAFTQVMFAIHYAHDYYLGVGKGHDGGLCFPGEDAPDYGDFLYFSCSIGTSGQTADVGFTSRTMRRTGTLHCVLAFFFNTTLIALTINIMSGLFNP